MANRDRFVGIVTAVATDLRWSVIAVEDGPHDGVLVRVKRGRVLHEIMASARELRMNDSEGAMSDLGTLRTRMRLEPSKFIPKSVADHGAISGNEE